MDEIELLKKFETDDSVLEEIEKIGSRLLDVAFDAKLYKSLIKLMTPNIYNINGELIMKIVFDPFSYLGSQFLYKIQNSFLTKEEAEKSAMEEYNYALEHNKGLSEDDISYDSRSLQDILSSKTICPIKNEILGAIYNVDFDRLFQIKIKDSHARQISGTWYPIRTAKDVVFYAEPACIMGCKDLFEKNIRTTMNDTEGVIEDMPAPEDGYCFIHIDQKSLSDENMEIVQELIDEGLAEKLDNNEIRIFVSCSRDETVGEVSNKLTEIIKRFEKQDILFGKDNIKGVLKSLNRWFEYFPDIVDKIFPDGKATPERVIEFSRECNIDTVYDADENVFWAYPEYLKKHQEFINTNKKTASK